ncbi:MAG: hypothetical protein ABIM89_17920 [Mycobacteriales bacterium]
MAESLAVTEAAGEFELALTELSLSELALSELALSESPLQPAIANVTASSAPTCADRRLPDMRNS